MTNQSTSLGNGERGENGSSWFNRLAANLGFSNADARSVIENALAEDDGTAFTVRERAMLQRVLQFKDLRLEDVMVPRVDIVAIEENQFMVDLMALFRKAGYSRIPVYRDTLDEPLGMVHTKDLLSWRAAEKDPVATPVGLGGIDLGYHNCSERYSPRGDLRTRLDVGAVTMASTLGEQRVHKHKSLANGTVFCAFSYNRA
jgi:hypothetical protein